MFKWLRKQLMSTVSRPASWFSDLLTGGVGGDAGVKVSVSSSLQLSTVSRCVNLIADTVAGMPLGVFLEDESAKMGVRALPRDPLHRVLNKRPNKFQSPFVFKKYMMLNLLTEGNAYAFVVRNGRGEVQELIPLDARLVWVYRLSDGSKWFYFTFWEGTEYFECGEEDMLHLVGMSVNGYAGISPIMNAARTMGVTIAAEKFGAKFFANGIRPSAVMTVKGKMTKEGIARIQNQYYAMAGGLDNAQGLLVIPEAEGKFEPVSITPQEAQFLELRNFQVEDICRIYGVPPHMVGATNKQTSWGSGIEQMKLGFLMFTLKPYLDLWESTGDMVLLDENKGGKFLSFETKYLERGDLKSQVTAFKELVFMGAFSPNDVLRELNMNPRPGGDVYVDPSKQNVAAGVQAGEGETEDAEPSQEEGGDTGAETNENEDTKTASAL